MKKDELVEQARARLMALMRRPGVPRDCIKLLDGDAEVLPPLIYALRDANIEDGRYDFDDIDLEENEALIDMAILLYQAEIPGPAYKTLFNAIWEDDCFLHSILICKVGSRAQMARMFKQTGTASDLPAEIGDVFTIFRGVKLEPDIARAAKGYSWTLDRCVACQFAAGPSSFISDNGYVISATIRRSDVVYYSDRGDEKEIITARPPENYKIDGDLKDRIAAARRQSARLSKPVQELNHA